MDCDKYIHVCNHHWNKTYEIFLLLHKVSLRPFVVKLLPYSLLPSLAQQNNHCFCFYQISSVLPTKTSHKLNHLVFFTQHNILEIDSMFHILVGVFFKCWIHLFSINMLWYFLTNSPVRTSGLFFSFGSIINHGIVFLPVKVFLCDCVNIYFISFA